MSLSWSEIAERWPDACVAWDALGAPFDAVFVEWAPTPESSSLIEAVAPSCRPSVHWVTQWNPHPTGPRVRCKCLRWDGAQWLPRYITAPELLHPEFRREYLGQFVDNEPDDDRVAAMRYSMRGGKTQRIRTRVAERIARGPSVVVATPDGEVDGDEWLDRHR